MTSSKPESSERSGQESGFSSEDEIEPLLNCPYYTVHLTKTQVKYPYKLCIPASFLGNLPDHLAHVVLSHHGKFWEMDCLWEANKRRKFSPEWKHFVLDNNLEVGDACLFELMERNDDTAKFKVQVLRGDLPNELLEKMDNVGKRSDIPIVIDD